MPSILSDFTFYISLEVLYYNWSCFNELYYVIFILISNEAIKVADLQKSTSQLMLNAALVIEMVNNPFSESKKNFASLIKENVLIKMKIKILVEEPNADFYLTSSWELYVILRFQWVGRASAMITWYIAGVFSVGNFFLRPNSNWPISALGKKSQNFIFANYSHVMHHFIPNFMLNLYFMAISH